MDQVTDNNRQESVRAVAELLYGDGAWEISKAMTDTTKRRVTAGLSAVGATAGAAGLGYAGLKTGGAYRIARLGAKTTRVNGAKPLVSRGKALKEAVKHEKVGAALIPLEVAGLGGEIMATKILHGDTKKKHGTTPVKKAIAPVRAFQGRFRPIKSAKIVAGHAERVAGHAESAAASGARAAAHGERAAKKVEHLIPGRKTAVALGVGGVGALGGTQYTASYYGTKRAAQRKSIMSKSEIPTKGELVQVATNKGFEAAKGAPAKVVKTKKGVLRAKTVVNEKITKSVDIEWRGEISKVDEEKRQIFGWASIVELDGKPVVDLQGDYMSVDEIEKAAYTYVQKSRKGGLQHRRAEDGTPHQVSEMIESLMVTSDKKAALGLSPDTPTGWWVGFQINDDDTWQDYKSGKRTQLSIHGTGVRRDHELVD